MNFWLRNLILGGVLALLAWAFFANQDLLLSLDGPVEQENQTEITTNDEPLKPVPDKDKKHQKGKPSSNAAADGLSRFYANLYGEKDGKGPKIRNNIVYLPDPKGDIKKILQTRELIVRPYKKNWKSITESRPFRKGDTLNQKLVEYSAKEGIDLMWWLNRDYVVKDPFRIKKDILRTTFQVAKAVEGHFESGLSVFFCNKQRAVIVIESEPHPFLDAECIKLESTNSY